MAKIVKDVAETPKAAYYIGPKPGSLIVKKKLSQHIDAKLAAKNPFKFVDPRKFFKAATQSTVAKASAAPVSKRPKVVTAENLAKAIERATTVLGGTNEALRWLGTPVAGLNYATPISLLGTKNGRSCVEDILTQIEHGVW